MGVRHVYLHVPFCDGKCVYCAFFSRGIVPGQADAWLEAVTRQMASWNRRAVRLRPLTVYMGGGTPSVLSPSQWETLCDRLRGLMTTDRLREWTVEANPGTLDAGKLAILRRAGVNRVSLGVQSMSDRVLSLAGRRHDAAEVRRTFALVREAGFDNVGLDLIAGLPGADRATWRATVDEAIALRPSHISVYALGVEEGSELHRRAAAGTYRPPRDADMLVALDLARRALAADGYERYEVSNFCRDGRRCLHNMACWRGRDYIGFGPAAASRVGRRRWTVVPDLDAYLRASASGREPPRASETLTPARDAAERLMFALRVCDGVGAARIVAAPEPLRSHWAVALEELRREGLVKRQHGRWTPTRRGFLFADRIAETLLP